MKPSQFKRLEKQALRQRLELKGNILKAEKAGDNFKASEHKEALTDLVETMKSLKGK